MFATKAFFCCSVDRYDGRRERRHRPAAAGAEPMMAPPNSSCTYTRQQTSPAAPASFFQTNLNREDKKEFCFIVFFPGRLSCSKVSLCNCALKFKVSCLCSTTRLPSCEFSVTCIARQVLKGQPFVRAQINLFWKLERPETQNS